MQKRGQTADPLRLMNIQVNNSKMSNKGKQVIKNKRNGSDAGMTSLEFNTIDRLNTIICKESKRTYREADETQRKLES